MFTIEIVAIGKLSQFFLRDGCDEYVKRARPYYRIKVTELPEEKPMTGNANDERRILESEASRIIKHIDKQHLPVIALAVEGEKLCSEDFATFLENSAVRGSGVVILIGGSLGLAESVKQRAEKCLSISDMTFPHQLARLLLLEQIYRAATINNRIKYHK